MNYSSTIHRHLTTNEINDFNNELSLNKDNLLWNNHASNKTYMTAGALRYGKTLWLYELGPDLKLYQNHFSYFPKTRHIVNELIGTNKLGRTYWHKLSPGDQIDKHTDTRAGNPYFKSVLKRYQIYLDIPDDLELVIDNRIQSPDKYRNCILDFNMTLPHYYKNNSDEDVIFAVADVLSSHTS